MVLEHDGFLIAGPTPSRAEADRLGIILGHDSLQLTNSLHCMIEQATVLSSHVLFFSPFFMREVLLLSMFHDVPIFSAKDGMVLGTLFFFFSGSR